MLRYILDPKVDYAFKRLFGSLPYLRFLLALVNALHQHARRRPVTSLELRNPFPGKEHESDKAPIYDVVAVDQGQRQHHLEMQGAVRWSFTKRDVYYTARLHGQQLYEGDAYETLRPTISVAFLDEVHLADGRFYHRFVLSEPGSGVILTEDLDITLIELPKFDLPARACREPLQQWCYFLKHAPQLDRRNLPKYLDQAIFREALEVLEMLSHDEIERQRYEDRRKARLDHNSTIYFEEHGREAFLNQGREEGLEKGELIGRVQLMQRFLRQPVTPREELLRQPVASLEKVLKHLERQLPPTP